MPTNTFLRCIKDPIIAVLVVTLAVLVGAFGYAFDDPTLDRVAVDPPAKPMLHSIATQVIPPPTGATVPPEENWAADESSHGLRPDAAH